MPDHNEFMTAMPDDVIRALLETAPDALVAVDAEGTVVYANEQTEKLFGWPPDELVGTTIEQLVPDRFRSAHSALRESYADGPETRPMGSGLTLAGRRRDGSEFPIEVSLSPFDTATGRLFTAAIRDVTETRRTEQKFRAILAAAPDPIIGVGRNGRIQLVNSQAERVFGWAAYELIGQMLDVLIPPAFTRRHAELHRKFTEDPTSRPMGAGNSLTALRRDGSTFPVEISLSPINDESGELVVLAAVRDITDRVQLEADRQQQALAAQREQLQRLESLGQLAGGIAHDFNNLLSVIMSYTSVAANQDDMDAVRADLEVVRHATERAASLTRQLLTFSRRDADEPETLDVGAMLDTFSGFLTRTIGEHIKISVVHHAGSLCVIADPSRLEQVLLNLVLNARDAMPVGGELVISTDAVRIDASDSALKHIAEGSYVTISVTDTGSGMSNEVQHRAFEPFFTSKARGEGTGLGLASAYGIITKAGGTIEIASELGSGTTMTVVLPAGEEPTIRIPDETELDRGQGRILVVDDNDDLRTVTSRMLTSQGYTVMSASGGIEALEIAADLSGKIDLLLTDVGMPEMSGPELAEQLTRRYPDVPVLFVSGYSEGSFQMRNDDPVVNKPFTLAELLDSVSAMISQ